MFIIRNALRNVGRTKGRSILMGIIIMILAFSMCIGLSIREASSQSGKAALANLSVTAQISVNREKAMEKASGSSGQASKSEMIANMPKELTLTQLKKSAEASSVKSFYYTLSASVDGAGDFSAYSSGTSSSGSSATASFTTTAASSDSTTGATASSGGDDFKGGRGGMNMGDFTITGYSSDEAMTDFTDGTSEISSGSMFEEGTSDMVCVISSTLAKYNGLSVGDTVKIANPSDSSEKYKLKIVGIYTTTSSQTAMGPGMTDSANNIYVSYNTLNKIIKASAKTADDGEEIQGRLNGTYVLGSVSNYNKFKKEVKSLGLSSSYQVVSNDIQAYENSAKPLKNLAKYAGYFLIVIFGVGAAVLLVMNIFSARERKYEIGVLSAIGMKKKQISRLFIAEILAVTIVGAGAGGLVGALASKPISTKLLAASTASLQSQESDSFGRGGSPGGHGGPGGGMPGNSTGAPSDSSSASDSSSQSSGSGSSNANAPGANGATETPSSVNLKVILEMMGLCLAMSCVGGAASVAVINRSEPLEILQSRD
ncbi:MAG: ABC transporter permease [Eubacteriales bacterium]|nr:ABC transporter permease [Eubacteriales bacterium]